MSHVTVVASESAFFPPPSRSIGTPCYIQSPTEIPEGSQIGRAFETDGCNYSRHCNSNFRVQELSRGMPIDGW